MMREAGWLSRVIILVGSTQEVEALLQKLFARSVKPCPLGMLPRECSAAGAQELECSSSAPKKPSHPCCRYLLVVDISPPHPIYVPSGREAIAGLGFAVHKQLNRRVRWTGLHCSVLWPCLQEKVLLLENNAA